MYNKHLARPNALNFLLIVIEGNPILFLGPGYGSSGQIEAFTLPTDESPMTKASCTVPTYPLTNINGAVGFVTPDGLELCGKILTNHNYIII